MNGPSASRRRRPEATVERRRRSRRTSHVGVSTLMYAAQQGDVDVVKKIIGVRRSPRLFDRDRTGKTALHYSSSSQRRTAAEAADLLVMAAPDLIDGTDEDGFTPLHLAVIAGNMQLVNFLLANGADVNALDNEQHTVVHWATVCGETSALRAVLTAGAHVSTPDVHGGYPLHYAAQMGAGEKDSELGMQVLRTLLSHPAVEVSCEDADKRQPLLWAASSGSAGAVLSLIRAAAAVVAADKDGLTALHCAASRGHTDCVDTLLTLCGASVDVIDTNGCTALHYAVTLGHADATALLLAHGADPNRQDRKGRSPAHCGCAKGQFETVKLIGNRGANLWLRNARGDFPLHDAAAAGRRELVKWLLEMRPSQANARNNDGKCPLHAAAFNDNADMCKVPSGKYKRKKGAIKEAMSYFKETIDGATDYLMTNINTNIIISSNILLDAGAEVNPILRTSKNAFVTPLDCALQKGHRSTAKFLQVHGGVPAARLSDLDAPLSVRIRDDVTLYGGSSSENENKRKTDGKAKLTKQKSTDKASKEDKKRCLSTTPTGRMDFSNEITINGRLNITQSNGIVIDNKESVQTQTSARPRSAKYGKFRDRSAQSSINKEIMVSISSQASVSKIDHATSTSEEPQKTMPDEVSFTSEDMEEPKKDIVVEAAVHPRPKSPLVDETSKKFTESKVTIETAIEVDETTVVEESKSSEFVKTEEVIKENAKIEGENVQNDVKKDDSGKKIISDNELTNLPQTKENIEKENVEGDVKKDDFGKKIISDKKPTNLRSKEEKIEKESVQNDVKKDADGSVKNGIIDNKQTILQSKKEKIEDYSDSSVFSDEEDSLERTHRSFRVLKDKHPDNELRSRSLETKEKSKRSKIPTPLTKHPLSKSDRNLHQSYKETNLDVRVPSLPNISRRCLSNISAPLDRDSLESDVDDIPKGKSKRLVKRRSKTSRDARSAGSDYESSNLIDSGFEPSPRSTRVPKWRNVSERGVNMTTVTQTIQSNIRRYHLERKIFQQLLELKRHQIRVGQHDEAVLVKRAVDAYHKSCASTVGVGRYLAEDYTFKSFERFLYEALRRLQKTPAVDFMKGLPARANPLHCTRSTNRCLHAAHAYTGVPCAAYLPKMDHHTIPKIGFNDSTECRPGTGCFLPTINLPKRPVTLELSRGNDKQVICLPTSKLDQNKRYYVTFTVKDGEKNSPEINENSAHRHSKSD